MEKEMQDMMLKKTEPKELMATISDASSDASFQDEKQEKAYKYRILNQLVKKEQIVLVGSSLMENFPINELQQRLDKHYIIYNRGISGFVTAELLNHMEECIFELEPAKLFINIGTNDIGSPDYRKENLMANYDEILNKISKRLPDCKVYVMAYYPVNAKADFPAVDKEHKAELFKTRRNPTLLQANQAIEQLAKKYNNQFINVNEGLMDEEGNLKEEYSIDGIHMWPNGYTVVLGNLEKFLG